MTWPFKSLICALAALSLSAVAQEYHPAQTVSGVLRVWGNPMMSGLAAQWAAGFRKFHPGISFEINLMGTDTGMSAVYLGKADLALFGREPNTTDSDGFLHVLQYRPLTLELVNGSLDVPGKSYALAAFVHKDNPLTKLTMEQLQSIFGCENGLRTWDQLGLAGKWKNKPIHLYAFDVDSGTGQFFLHAVLGGSRKLNWEHLKEFKDIHNPNGTTDESGRQIIAALRKDPYGIAVSSLRYADPEVKPLALAAKGSDRYVEATRDNLIARTYPLARRTYVFANQPPDTALDPKVKEFLRYTLSREGQEDVIREGGFLPLSDETAQSQLAKIR